MIVAYLLMFLLGSGAGARPAWPSGQMSPEGAACDLARSFAQRDASMFRRLSFSHARASGEYVQMIKTIADAIESDKRSGTVRSDSPVRIEKCFKARSLSASGPASYGYAALGLADVKFVDVVVKLRSGSSVNARTLVVQTADKKWYVVPVADAIPLLSVGLDKETPSVEVARQ